MSIKIYIRLLPHVAFRQVTTNFISALINAMVLKISCHNINHITLFIR